MGAYAMAAHGYPRATGDIDLWVRCTPENARRILSALSRFGAPLDAVSEADFADPGLVVQLGVTPRRIDLLTAIDGVSFDDAWRARIAVEVDGLEVPVISKTHLVMNKRAAGRPKDIADVRALEDQVG